MTEKQNMGAIPEHLRAYDWYAPHQAWLRDTGRSHHDPGGAPSDRASLVGARLDRASLDRASLVGARLDRASLVGARLVGASLDGASLDGASLVGASLVDAQGIDEIPREPTPGLAAKVLTQIIEHPETHDQECWPSECETKHCCAGLAVVLTGPEGQAAEARLGTRGAAERLLGGTGHPFGPEDDPLPWLRERAAAEKAEGGRA